MIVISDTTPILSLIKIDRLKILEELYKKIIIPKAVYDELIINIDYQDEIDIIKRCTFIQIENVEENLSVVLLQRELKLDRGESEAIVLAKNINADLIIIDERKARRIAYVLFLVVASDRPEGATPPPADVPISQTIGNVLRLKHIWIIGLTMICFMVGNMTVSIYLTTALTTRGIPVTTAGFVTSAFATGIMIGTIFGGAVILKIGKGKFRIPSLFVGIIGGICIYVGWTFASPAISAVLMFIGALCCGALVPVSMSAMVYIPGMKPEYMGAAGGYANMMRFLAAFVFPSYIIAPIAGNNFNVFMIFAAVAVVLFGVFTMGLPEVLEKQPDPVS